MTLAELLTEAPEALTAQAGLLALVGVFVGFGMALVGVGGGVVMVPALIGLFTLLETPADVATRLAAATSLAVIAWSSLLTLLSAEGRAGARRVDRWDWTAMALGAVAGPLLAVRLPASVFAGLLAAILTGVAMGRLVGVVRRAARRRSGAGSAGPAASSASAAGGDAEAPPVFRAPNGVKRGFFACSGAGAAAFGLGGGLASLIVARLNGRPFREAIEAAPMFALAVALPGLIGFVLLGSGVAERPWGSLGFVSLPAFAACAVVAPIGARAGLWARTRLSDAQIATGLAVYLVCAAAALVARGVFG